MACGACGRKYTPRYPGQVVPPRPVVVRRLPNLPSREEFLASQEAPKQEEPPPEKVEKTNDPVIGVIGDGKA